MLRLDVTADFRPLFFVEKPRSPTLSRCDKVGRCLKLLQVLNPENNGGRLGLYGLGARRWR